MGASFPNYEAIMLACWALSPKEQRRKNSQELWNVSTS